MGLGRDIARCIGKNKSHGLASEWNHGGTPVPTLDIKANVRTVDSPASTGTQATTGVGFQPKVLLPFGVANIGEGGATHVLLSSGAATSSSNRYTNSIAAQTSVSTSNTNRSTSSMYGYYQPLWDETTFEAADLDSFGADGFTLDWATVTAASRTLNCVSLGGSDLEVSLTLHQMNTNNAAQAVAHGLSGGAPTALLFGSATNANAPPSTIDNLLFSYGAWAGSSQWCSSIASTHGVSTSNATRRLETNTVVSWYLSGASRRSFGVSSVDSTNVNLSYVDTTVTAFQPYFWMLAVRGCTAKAGTLDANGTTSPFSITTTGVTPKLFLTSLVPLGVDSPGTVSGNLLLTMGASDGTTTISAGVSEESGLATTNCRRWQSDSTLVEYNVAGTKASESTIGFSGESVVVTPSTNAGTSWLQGGYLALGI